MKLLSINIDCNLQYGLGLAGNIEIDNPPPKFRGWRIAIRGPKVMLVSPPGWLPANATSPAVRDPKGASRVVEVPYSKCVPIWEGVDAIDRPEKYDSEIMRTTEDRRQAEAMMADLDRATAPAKAGAR